MTSNQKAPSALSPALVITAVGPDRSGLIFELSSLIRDHGGNIEDTKMSKLGGMFAVLMLITGPERVLDGIEAQREDLQSSLGVSCSFARTTADRSLAGESFHFSASGLDRPGIVTALSDLLAKRNVNVISFLSRIENAPLSGTPLFVVELDCVLLEGASKSDIMSELRLACEREGLELQES